MRSAVALGNVVGETEYRLLVRIVPLHRNIHGNSIAVSGGVEDVGVKHRLRPVHVFDKAPHPAAKREVLFLSGTPVYKEDSNTVVQERKLA